jgi:hypothetical protein
MATPRTSRPSPYWRTGPDTVRVAYGRLPPSGWAGKAQRKATWLLMGEEIGDRFRS